MAVPKIKRGVSDVCGRLGMSRQWFYKARKAKTHRRIDEDLILALVRQERETNPRAGTKKVLVAIRPELEKAGVKIGRNRLGALLKRNGLLVEPRKSFRCRTTRQDPSLPPSSNLIKDFVPTAPDQALCSDITYVFTEEGFLFVSLAMDMFARDIVGFAIEETLGTQGPLGALAMAGRTIGTVRGVIAHSDRGCQYASRAYREALAAMGWLSSMTESLHCYENAMAERLNGILKGEYFLDRRFRTKAEATAAVKEAIWIYNHRRLHERLGYKTPSQFRAEWHKGVA